MGTLGTACAANADSTQIENHLYNTATYFFCFFLARYLSLAASTAEAALIGLSFDTLSS